MNLILLIIILLILFGGGIGYRGWGPVGGGISVGTILVIVLILYLLGVLG